MTAAAQPASARSWTAADMLVALRRHYLPEGRPAGGLFADEIGAPDGRRRADLIWAPTSMSGTHEDCLVGHEVKVSRADIVSELADPTKADSWAQYCTRWWLVIPDPALLDGLAVPDMWGVLAPPSGRRTRSMTVLKAAPRLSPAGDLAPALTRLMAYTTARLEAPVRALERQVADQQRLIALLEEKLQHRQRVELAGNALGAVRLERAVALLAAVDARAGAEKLWVGGRADLDVVLAEAVVDRLATLDASREVRQRLEALTRAVDAACEPFRRMPALDRAVALAARLQHPGAAPVPDADDVLAELAGPAATRPGCGAVPGGGTSPAPLSESWPA